MDLDRGPLARIDRRLLGGLGQAWRAADYLASIIHGVPRCGCGWVRLRFLLVWALRRFDFGGDWRVWGGFFPTRGVSK